MDTKRAPLGVLSQDTFLKTQETDGFFYVGDLRKTLKKHNLPFTGKKGELQHRLNEYFTNIKKEQACPIKNYSAIKIQRAFREWRIQKNTQGPGFLNKSLCVNDEDFLTFETKEEISEIYFFSFKEGNSVFFFDIRSFKKLVETNAVNPYTRTNIPEEAIKAMKLRLNQLKENPKYRDFPKEKLSDSQRRDLLIVKIFQTIDALEVAAGGVNHNHFREFTFNQLKKFYCELEDVWNYRAALTPVRQNQIVPNRRLFPWSPAAIKIMKESNNVYNKLQKIILGEMEALITSSNNMEDRKTGGYYILIALVETSIEYANDFPWLIQGL
jgi:hypothetical protein